MLAPAHERSPPVRRSLLRRPLDVVARRYSWRGRQQAMNDRLSSPPLDQLGELLRLIVGNDARSMSLPDLAGEIVELVSSGALNCSRKGVIGMRGHSRTPLLG